MRSPLLVPVLLLAVSVVVLAGATAAMLAEVEPFATWYYQFAWYPTLVAADAVMRLRTGRFFLLDRPSFAAALFAWSVPFWLMFELLNFRMMNWYYVFVPRDPAIRWVGISIAFATVLPAILISERLLRSFGVAAMETRGLAIGRSTPAALQVAGVLMVALALVWPRIFYPLIWGAVTLLLDPWTYRRAPERSLLGALEAGRPGRILRLLGGGLLIGVAWELLNSGARSKWIYTVPGLEELKLFEMPLAGFLGFPVLALDGWAFWQALVVAGVAPAPEREGPPSGADDVRGARERAARRDRPASARRVSPVVRIAVGIAAVLFSAGVLRGLERFTISSYSPRLEDLPGVRAGPLLAAGYEPFELAAAGPPEVARATGLPLAEAERAVQRARLATLRGIGTANARALVEAGVGTVETLAEASPEALTRRLDRTGARPIPPARVRVWVHAAREATTP